MNAIILQIDDWGKRIFNAVKYAGTVFLMVYLSIRSSVAGKRQQNFSEVFKILLMQVYFTGVQALPLLGMLALLTGTITIIQGTSQLSKLGGGEMLGNLIIMLVVRELAPLMTTLVVVARSGTAVASELGNMKVNSEIEALESMGIDPLSFIVFPRIVGGIVSVVCLSLYFSAIAIFGGYLVAQFIAPISFSFFVDNITQAVSTADAWMFLIKNVFSGAMIFTICCHQGLLVKQSFSEVPQVTTAAVVTSIMYTVGFNSIVSLGFYLRNLKELGVL